MHPSGVEPLTYGSEGITFGSPRTALTRVMTKVYSMASPSANHLKIRRKSLFLSSISRDLQYFSV